MTKSFKIKPALNGTVLIKELSLEMGLWLKRPSGE